MSRKDRILLGLVGIGAVAALAMGLRDSVHEHQRQLESPDTVMPGKPWDPSAAPPGGAACSAGHRARMELVDISGNVAHLVWSELAAPVSLPEYLGAAGEWDRIVVEFCNRDVLELERTHTLKLVLHPDVRPDKNRPRPGLVDRTTGEALGHPYRLVMH